MGQKPLESIDMGGLMPTLLDFERMPGRYRLALREPGLLFEQTLAVLQLAAGRPVKGLAPWGTTREAQAAQQTTQRAARFFVRTVLLRAGTDHYALLGLQPGFEPEALRDHYRLLIRLTHPDFSAPGTEWPADAASRINIAHGVLGSAVQRAQYDASLKAAASAMPQGKPTAPTPTPASPVATPRPAPAAHPRSFEDRERIAQQRAQQRTQQRRKIALVTGGALACAALLWLATPGSNDGSLMAQRAPRAAQPDSVTEDAKALANKLMASAAQLKEQPGAAPAAERTAAPELALALAPVAVPAPAAVPATAPVVAVAPVPAPAPVVAVVAVAPLRAAAPVAEPIATPVAAPVVMPIAAPVATPAPKPVVTPSVEPAMEPVAVAVAVVAAAAPTTAPRQSQASAEVPLTLARVQPMLAQVLDGLQSGHGENVTQWLYGPWRDHPAANTFVTTYTRLVAGQRVVQLGQVKLRSRWMAEQFVVDGVVELHVQDSGAVQQVRRLQMSAHFVPKGGQAVLTQVVLNNP